MVPKIVKKIHHSELRYENGEFYVPTRLLKELNITEDEPFQIKGGPRDGSFIIVREFWQREVQTSLIINQQQVENCFSHLFKDKRKKEEYDKMKQQSYFKHLKLKLTEQELFYIRDALELGFKQMPQDDKETYDEILKMFQEK